MSCQFLAPTRPGTVYCEVNVTKVTESVAFANAKLYADEACIGQPTAFATCVNKLRAPFDEAKLYEVRKNIMYFSSQLTTSK